MSLNFDTISSLVSSLGVMRFFPSDPEVRLALVGVMGEIAEDEEQVRWLVKRMRIMYAEWPGEHEMRACFCSRFRPKDGYNVASTVYLDGLPSEFPDKQFKLLPLPKGALISTDPDIERSVLALAQAKDLNQIGKRRTYVPGVPEVPNLPPEKRITLADVERAVNELHEKRARVELSGGD